MEIFQNIPEPFLFNPLKHHLACIRSYVHNRIETIESVDKKLIIKDLRHMGTAVMDVYKGTLTPENICNEIRNKLGQMKLAEKSKYSAWTGVKFSEFKIIGLTDGSEWTMKYHNNESRYIHFFPARSGPYTFRVKANTLKSAVLYLILAGKDFINVADLNYSRALIGLSPVGDIYETEAITEMIELLRYQDHKPS